MPQLTSATGDAAAKPKQTEENVDIREKEEDYIKLDDSQQEEDIDEEEEDYMSEDFLKSLERQSQASNKNRTYSERRKITVRQQKERGIIKPLKEREKESLERGLATKIGEENKGFAMLAKMGYTDGMTIGKNKDGLVEPLPVVKKAGKGGIGLPSNTTARKRALDDGTPDIESDQGCDDASSAASFRERANARFALARLTADIKRCRKTCEQLDNQAGTEDGKAYYWPSQAIVRKEIESLSMIGEVVEVEVEVEGSEEEEEDVLEDPADEARRRFEELDVEEMFKEVNTYLRERHHYCLYCGEKYASDAELVENCPGPTSDDH